MLMQWDVNIFPVLDFQMEKSIEKDVKRRLFSNTTKLMKTLIN